MTALSIQLNPVGSYNQKQFETFLMQCIEGLQRESQTNLCLQTLKHFKIFLLQLIVFNAIGKCAEEIQDVSGTPISTMVPGIAMKFAFIL